jgi:hypothetical protein
MKNKIYIIGVTFLLVSIFYLFTPITNLAQASVNVEKDSDYDGLSDQVEITIYHTDPLKADTDGDGYLDSAEVLVKSDPLDNLDPASSLQNPGVSKTSISVPWYVARAAGIVAYILIFLIVVLGTGMTTGYIYNYINPVKSWLIHKYLSLALGLTLLTHIVSLLFDKFINFNLLDVLIPFASSYKPIFLSLGILGFYLLLVIIFTSVWFRLKYKRAWRFVHYFTYALFIASLIHGLLIGTDSTAIWMQIIYVSTGLIFLGLVIYRFSINLLKNLVIKK